MATKYKFQCLTVAIALIQGKSAAAACREAGYAETTIRCNAHRVIHKREVKNSLRRIIRYLGGVDYAAETDTKTLVGVARELTASGRAQ